MKDGWGLTKVRDAVLAGAAVEEFPVGTVVVGGGHDQAHLVECLHRLVTHELTHKKTNKQTNKEPKSCS